VSALLLSRQASGWFARLQILAILVLVVIAIVGQWIHLFSATAVVAVMDREMPL
jgi:hypothetical protein